MPVPVTARETVWSPVTAALAVAVTVMTVEAASVPVLALTERLTAGAESLSVMAMFCAVVAPSAIPELGLEIVIVAVSVTSARASSVTVKVTVPVVAPFRIVIVELDKV